MEVVSTSSLVCSKAEETTTAGKFQTVSSFVMSHDLIRGQKKILLCSFMIVEL